MDYQDGYDYRRHAREAAQQGIAIETIQCGEDPRTAEVWREIASLAYGHFARIDANGGMPARVTPADAELARLNRELAATVVAYGSRDERAAASNRLDDRAAMPAPMAAEAAGYFAKTERLAEKDLVTLSVADQKQALRDKRDQPALLQGKPEPEQLQILQQQKERRQKLQAQILEAQKQRAAYLKGAAPAEAGFDEQVIDKLRERAAAAGIKY
jgi:hypothetical protein